MKNLVIVESPSKSKTIEKYLGKDFEVLSSKGHIRELGVGGKGNLGVDVENNFESTYVLIDGKKKLVDELKKKVKEVDNVYLATDPDREGEAISWHLAKVLDLDLDKQNRVVFNEITKNAVIQAFNHPRKLDLGLVKSQETRRILDRIIGFKLSTLLYRKIKSASAGRVQSVALRMICDREKEILAFKPEEYWTIKALINYKRKKIEANLVKYDGKKIKISNQEQALKIFNEIKNPLKVVDIKKEDKKRSPKPAFITSTLQQEASTKFGFSAKKTMMIAQKLYEGVMIKNEPVGLITYMRTDSNRLSNDFVKDVQSKILKEYGKEYVGNYKLTKDSKAQDAHEAIRPTNIENLPEKIKEFLTNDEYKIYSFIYYRAFASLMKECVNTSTTYSLLSNKSLFTINGQVLKFDGFLKVYHEYDSSKDVIIPELSMEQEIEYQELLKDQHFTEPPSRYSEARLIKSLEEEGVGRPSTYATIVDTIIKRNYVEVKKNSEKGKTKYFFPTEQGLLTDEKLRQFFSEIINIKYTAKMEEELDEISLNKINYVDSLRKFWNDFIPLIENANEKMEKLAPEKTGEICPKCGGNLIIRKGRYGKFICCDKFPSCNYTDNLKKEKIEPEFLEENCPQCGGRLIKRKSRYGKFFAGCSNYPKCKYLKNL